MATVTYVPALRSLNHRLSAFVDALGQPGVTPKRLLTILADAETAHSLLGGYSPSPDRAFAPKVKAAPTMDSVDVARSKVRADAMKPTKVAMLAPKPAKAAKVEASDARRFDWKSATSLLSKVMDKRSSAPILACVHVTPGGSVEATDLESFVHLERVASTNAEVCIPVASLSALDGSLDVSGDHGEWIYSNGAKVAGIDPQDWPLMPCGDWATVEAMDAAALVSVLRPIQSAITAEDARYFLAGALLGACPTPWAVGTDGHRLAACGDTTVEAARVLVPRAVVAHLIAMKLGGSVRLQSVLLQGATDGPDGPPVVKIAHYRIIDSVGNWIAWKPIEGQFPAFDKVIAVDYPEACQVSVFAILDLCKMAKGFNKASRSFACSLGLTDAPGEGTTLDLRVQSPEIGEATYHVCAVVKRSGENIIGLNHAFLADAANAAKLAGHEIVSIHLAPGKDAADCQMIVKAPGMISVVMPMRM